MKSVQADDPLGLFQLVHQVGIGMEPAGGVHEHIAEAMGFEMPHGIENDGRRITAVWTLDHGDIQPLSLDRQLFLGCSAERVSGDEEALFPFVREAAGELGQ